MTVIIAEAPTRLLRSSPQSPVSVSVLGNGHVAGSVVTKALLLDDELEVHLPASNKPGNLDVGNPRKPKELIEQPLEAPHEVQRGSPA